MILGQSLISFIYEPAKVNRGYTDRVLYLNLSKKDIKIKEVPPKIKDTLIGGRGYGLWYLWQATKSDTKWNDPENELVFCTGPL